MPVSIKLKNVNLEFAKAEKEVITLINQAQRISAFQASSDLQQVTPIDTGRARSSWFTSHFRGDFRDKVTGVSENRALLGPVDTSKVETLYITNGTPYIKDLNQGSSQQAPPRFIEKTISKYFQVKGNSIRAT